jgi:hypothetical protein
MLGCPAHLLLNFRISSPQSTQIGYQAPSVFPLTPICWSNNQHITLQKFASFSCHRGLCWFNHVVCFFLLCPWGTDRRGPEYTIMLCQTVGLDPPKWLLLNNINTSDSGRSVALQEWRQPHQPILGGWRYWYWWRIYTTFLSPAPTANNQYDTSKTL